VFRRLSFLSEDAQSPQITFSKDRLVLKDATGTSPQKFSYGLATEGVPNFAPIFQRSIVPSQSREVTFRQKARGQPRPSKFKPYDSIPELPHSRQVVPQELAGSQSQCRPVKADVPLDLEPSELAPDEIQLDKPVLDNRRPKDVSGEKKKVRRGWRHIRTTEEAADPQKAKDMNTSEHYQLKTKLKGSAKELCDACLFPLPAFLFKDTFGNGSEHNSKAEGVLQLMLRWWDWLDTCRHALDQPQDGPQGSDYDWAVLRLAFMCLYRIDKVFGQERQICDEALQQ
jgi:hypothetical protein